MSDEIKYEEVSQNPAPSDAVEAPTEPVVEVPQPEVAPEAPSEVPLVSEEVVEAPVA